MQHMNKTLSPPIKPARVSVPVSAEALSAFQRLAKAGNMSTGRAIAEWLNDTVEAANFMAVTLEKAKVAPRLVSAQMHSYAQGLADETGELMMRVQAMAKDEERAWGALVTGAPATGLGDPISPSCNTGGKVTKNTNRPKGGKSS